MVQVAVSNIALAQKPDKGNPVWKKLTSSYRNVDVPIIELANLIWTGHSFTCRLKPNANGTIWREQAAFDGAQHLCLDFDTNDIRSSIEQLLKDPFIKRWAALLYSSFSSLPLEGKYRTRVVFFFPDDELIRQAKNYVLAAKALLWMFGTADPQCSDPARPWLGTNRGEMYVNTGDDFEPRRLPLDHIRDLAQRYEETKRINLRTFVPQPFNGKNDDATLNRLISRMASAGEGMRNGTLNECGFLLGIAIAEGRIDRTWGEQNLHRAALTTGLDDGEVRRTLTHALADGLEASAMSVSSSMRRTT